MAATVVIKNGNNWEEVPLFKGSPGPQGVTGEPGRAGIDGRDGKNGVDGKPGIDGVDGKPGRDGKTGFTGLSGGAGPTGERGERGADGPIGNTGPQGAPGETGATGAGVAAGGTTGQILVKIDNTEYNTGWATRAAAREWLAAPRTYYVRTDGNDANTGLINTSGGAWATIQHAYDVIASTLDFGNQTVTIQLGNTGIYTPGLNISAVWTGGGALVLQGAINAPSQATIDTFVISNGAGTVCSVSAPLPGTVTLTGFKTISSGNTVSVAAPGIVVINYLDFSTSGADHVQSSSGAVVNVQSGQIYVSGSVGAWGSHWSALNGGFIQAYGAHYVISTAITVRQWLLAQQGGGAQWGAATFTGLANVTGIKYTVLSGSIAIGSGTVLPGTSAGSGGTTTGGGFYT